MSERRLPLIVLTGFLGAGKSSLLRAALARPALARSAVLVNEFAETGIDPLLIGTGAMGPAGLAGGCLCCSGEAGMIEALAGLPLAGAERVIVETSGLAGPAAVLAALLADIRLARRFRPAGTIAVVDALADAAGRHEEAREQIALADAVVVTRLDLLPAPLADERWRRFGGELASLGAPARLLRRDAADFWPGFEALFAPGALSGPPGDLRPGAAVGRHQGIAALELAHDRPLPPGLAERFAHHLAERLGLRLLRLKGIVSIAGSERPMALHIAGGMATPPEPLSLPDWTAGATRLVVITRDVPAGTVEALFDAFTGPPREGRPDAAALTDNPLAVPGFRA